MNISLPHADSEKFHDLYRNADLIGSMWPRERAWLHWYAKTAYTGEGAIVDLGSWLGSSVIPLARGLSENPDPQAKQQCIHAYDIFIWADWMLAMNSVQRAGFAEKHKAGDSCLEEFWQQVTPWREQIEAHPGDLCKKSWEGGPIEFIFVDLMKSWALANATVRQFFANLIPGVSYIVHQDFAHHYTPWIHLLTYHLREYLVPVYDIPGTHSVVFNYAKAMPAELWQTEYGIDSFTEEQIAQAYEYCVSLVGPDKKPGVLSARPMLYYHANRIEKAKEEMDRLVDVTDDFAGEMAQMRSLVSAHFVNKK